ncbi:MAG TPA: hypothetical protein EYP10_15380, partial [Armatimonadetes bacterium]|nr:hypothetical protein [Armatimonadota bacterium]
MLIREWRDELHLFSCLSPAWVKPGSIIAIRNAPTDFGTLTATMQCTDYGAVISINARWRNPPRNLIIHFPWFVQVRRLIADGRTIALPSPTPFQPALLEPPLPARVIAVNLLATTRSVIAHWEWDDNVTASLSYTNAVNAWQDEYRNRYRTYVTAGYEPEPILIEAFARSFEERKRRWYEMLEQCGIATFKPVRASNTVPNSTPAFITDGDVSSRAPCWVS